MELVPADTVVAKKLNSLYNTSKYIPISPMKNTLASVGLSLAAAGSLLVPLQALAYLSPDAVFNTSSTAGGDATFDRTDPSSPPPTLRDADAIAAGRAAAGQQRLADQERANQEANAFADSYVAPDDDESLGLLDDEAKYKLRMERLAASKGNSPTIIIGGGMVMDSNGNILHSGAPIITSTGPESVLAAAVLVLASISTLAYAGLRHRRMTLA